MVRTADLGLEHRTPNSAPYYDSNLNTTFKKKRISKQEETRTKEVRFFFKELDLYGLMLENICSFFCSL